jgi:hypothetical protein
MRGPEHATLGIIILIIALFWLVFRYIAQARAGKVTHVRRIPGIDAVDEATGRAAEMGRPMAFSMGITDVGPTLYACLGVLFHVVRKCARYRQRCLVPQNSPEVLVIAEDTVREAFRSEGRLNAFEPRDIMFLSDEQFAYAAGYQGMVQRERIGSAMLFGAFAAESLILAEAGQQVGAMQVAASVNPEQVAFFICTCDYTLIGEELFATSAYLTKEPIQLGSLYAQDRAKLACLGLLLFGVFAATVKSVWGFELPAIHEWITYQVW